MTLDQFSSDRAPPHCGTSCGKCCQVAGTDRAVLMTRAEAEAAAQASGKTMAEPEMAPVRSAVRAAGCPFHGKNNTCEIYDCRPAGCRAYVCAGADPHEQHPEFADFFASVLEKSEPVADVRDWFVEDIASVMARHNKVALQFSGGKDSIATLLLMRPWWDRLTVYWLNTGDPFPEVVEVVEKVRAFVPNFVEIDGERDRVITQYGLPSDVVPYSSTPVTHYLGVAETPLLQDRFSCCARSVMLPLHEKMIEDGVTLIVRGQRTDETFKGKHRSGDIAEGFEVLYPIENWATEEVFAYIEAAGWEIPRYYLEGMPHSGDCLVCTAWVGDGRGAYLRKHYPERFEEYKEKLSTVALAAQTAINNLIDEVETCKVGG